MYFLDIDREVYLRSVSECDSEVDYVSTGKFSGGFFYSRCSGRTRSAVRMSSRLWCCSGISVS